MIKILQSVFGLKKKTKKDMYFIKFCALQPVQNNSHVFLPHLFLYVIISDGKYESDAVIKYMLPFIRPKRKSKVYQRAGPWTITKQTSALTIGFKKKNHLLILFCGILFIYFFLVFFFLSFNDRYSSVFSHTLLFTTECQSLIGHQNVSLSDFPSLPCVVVSPVYLRSEQ